MKSSIKIFLYFNNAWQTALIKHDKTKLMRRNCLYDLLTIFQFLLYRIKAPQQPHDLYTVQFYFGDLVTIDGLLTFFRSCLFIWSLNLSDLENDFWHFMQMLGFSPDWILICCWSLVDQADDFVHWEQLYGFSPVWTLIWTVNSLASSNDIVH